MHAGSTSREEGMKEKAIRVIAGVAFLANLYLLGLNTGYSDRTDCFNPYGIHGSSRYLVDFHLLLTLFLLFYLIGLNLKSKLSAIFSATALAAILFVYARGIALMFHNDELLFLDNLKTVAHPFDGLSFISIVILVIVNSLTLFRSFSNGTLIEK